MVKMTVIPIFGNTLVGTGGTGLSDVIDLMEIVDDGVFGFHYRVASTQGAGTAGTTVFSYLGCMTRGGTYISPAAGGTFGTSLVTHGNEAWLSLTPYVAPFIKIKAVVGTSNPALITAELVVR